MRSWITSSTLSLGRTGTKLAAAFMLASEICSISSVTTSQPRASRAASRASSHSASTHWSTTKRAGQPGSGSSTWMR